jgi:integrase
MKEVGFYIQKRKKNGVVVDKNIPIYAGFTYSGGRLMYYTGISSDEQNWDNEKGKQRFKRGVVQNGVPAVDLNNKLDKIKTAIFDIARKYEYNNEVLTIEAFKEELDRIFKDKEPEDKSTLNHHFAAFLATKGNNAPNTYEGYKQLGKLIFDEKKGRNERRELIVEERTIRMKDLNMDFLQDFVTRLQGRQAASSVKKNFIMFKTFLRYLDERGLINPRLLQFNPKIKIEPNKPVFLEPEELKKLEEYVPDSAHLQRAKDIFLFMCEIGCRYSDLSVLSKDSVQTDAGMKFIEYQSVKNKKGLEVPLTPKALEIIERWKDFKYKKRTDDPDYLIPLMPHTNFNDNMIKIGKESGIDTKILFNKQYVPKYQKLTAHVARRTFVMKCLRAGINHTVIMDWVGHSEFETFKKYYNITKTDSKRELAKLLSV